MPKKQDKSITIFNSMNTNNKKEKILPEIKLKYYCKNENSESPKNPDAVCYFCGKKNIAIGSVLDGYSDNPKFVCENCAIDRYKKDHKFKSKKIASARRRRIFDVNYLFNEMITDKYLTEVTKGKVLACCFTGESLICLSIPEFKKMSLVKAFQVYYHEVCHIYWDVAFGKLEEAICDVYGWLVALFVSLPRRKK